MPTYCKMYIYWTFEKLLWYGTIDRSGHRQERESMMDYQSGLEGFMRVPITMWTAVIWFKLLKGRETSSERDSGWKEECVAKRNGEMDLYQIAPFGIQAKYCLIGDFIFSLWMNFAVSDSLLFSISWFQSGLKRGQWCFKKFQSTSLLVSDFVFSTCWKMQNELDVYFLFLLTLCGFWSAEKLTNVCH